MMAWCCAVFRDEQTLSEQFKSNLTPTRLVCAPPCNLTESIFDYSHWVLLARPGTINTNIYSQTQQIGQLSGHLNPIFGFNGQKPFLKDLLQQKQTLDNPSDTSSCQTRYSLEMINILHLLFYPLIDSPNRYNVTKYKIQAHIRMSC